MTRHLSARARLTVVYTSLFAVCGGVLVVVTYFLLAHNLGSSGPKTSTDAQTAIQRCMQQASAKGVPDDTAKAKCTTTYANGVKAGASAQRGTALDQLL
ncbi:MAG TPA: hypothetical protein VKB75_02155, partial [Jatrophihabitans sp.]|nr:hypothetical protein [Jatrophihabitans sp.]